MTGNQTAPSHSLRWFLLLAAVAEAVLWAIVAFRGDLLPRPLDPAGFHLFFIFFVLPAASLELWGHGLTLATVSVSITGFVFVSTVLAGFFAS
jgi:hypothetical protein